MSEANFITYYQKVLEHFEGNEQKALMWFTSANQLFGGYCPVSMIILERGHKVYDFIDNSLDENERD